MTILNSQGNLLTVDPTSKAARTTLYDSAGNKLLQENPVGSYVLPINVDTTAIPTTYVWYMRNATLAASAPRIWYVRRISGVVYFNGTAAATTTVGYMFSKFYGAAHNQSGTTQTAIKKRTSDGRTNGFQPNNTVSQLDGSSAWSKGIDSQVGGNGLLLEDKTWFIDEKAFEVTLPISVTRTTQRFDIGLTSFELPLLPNEGLIIKCNPTSVAGQGILGSIEWDERSVY